MTEYDLPSDYKSPYYRDPVTTTELAAIALVVLVKLAFMLLLLRSGFVGLSGDDFARQITAFHWSRDPSFLPSGWPPLQFWILGTFISIFPNITAVNLFVNGLFSILSVIYLYFFVRLFFHKHIAILTVAIVAVFPWHLKLSLSGLCEPISHFFIIAALFYLTKWQEDYRTYLILLCTICLLLANMLRVEAWAFYMAVVIYVAVIYIKKALFIKHKSFVLLLLFLPSVFVLFWILSGRLQTNLGLIRDQVGISSVYLRPLRYPGYLMLISPIIALSGIFGCFHFKKYNTNLFVKYTVVPGLYLLGLISISIVAKSDSMTAPLRFVVPFIYILIPMSLFPFFNSSGNLLYKLRYVFFLVIISWNVLFVFKYSTNEFRDISKVAGITKKAWNQSLIKDDQSVLFEKNDMNAYRFDHLALKVLSNRPNHIFVFDRSMSEYSLKDVEKQAKEGKIGALVVSSRDVKRYFGKSYGNMTNIGPYRIFWTKKDSGQLETRNMFGATPPKSEINVKFGQCATLMGYTLDRSLFPLGVTTYWKILGDQKEEYEIQYALIPNESALSAYVISSHKLGSLRQIRGYKKGEIISDWQELKLGRKNPPSQYKLAVKLNGRPVAELCQSRLSDDRGWFPLTEVRLINNRRDVLKEIVKGSLDDWTIGVTVILSLFGC